MKKILFAALGLSILLLFFWFAFRERPKLVDAGVVIRGPLEITLDHEGHTRVRDRFIIRAPLDGRLRRIRLNPGDEVVSGATDLIVVDPLAPALLDQRSIAMAQAQVLAAEAGLEQAERAREQASDQLRLAQSEFERLERLQQAGASSRQSSERAERDLRLWEGEFERANAAIAMARFQLAVNQAALKRSRPEENDETIDHLEAFVLRSPIDGRVLQVNRRSEGPVSIGEPILELGDTRALEVVADYLSTDAVQIEAGMAARLVSWGEDRSLAARVRLVEPAGFTKVSALGVEEQRVNVILDLIEPAETRPPLGDGYRVESRVVLWSEHDRLKLPESALFRHGEGWAVFKFAGNVAQLVPLEVGRRNGIEAEVLEGLEEGDQIVLYPSEEIEDGRLIRARR